MDSRQIVQVSELTANIRNLLESRYPFVNVAGEISNLHRPSSGHYYFTLKDSQAQLRVVLFKMQRRYLAEEPKNGMEVVCRGRLSVFEARGEYQLLADTISFHGEGALRLSFEELKKKLAAEGLFDQEQKKAMPPMPRHITLITSPEGAAVQDFIRVATRRFPGIQLAVYPVPVQGEKAAAAIVKALRTVRSRLKTEVIVLCRGGGSMEDLWTFNDELLARTIREGELPVVSAVGHEIDFTIADFAADLRAPTPSAAAELLVPDKNALEYNLGQQQSRIERAIRHILNAAEQRLRLSRQHLQRIPHPLDALMLRVDQLRLSMELAMTKRISVIKRRVEAAGQSLERHNPKQLVDERLHHVTELKARLIQAKRGHLLQAERRFQRAITVLEAVSPLATLARGYAIARHQDEPGRPGKIIHLASLVRVGEQIEVLLHEGRLACRVEQVLAENGFTGKKE